jgi:hypothetical protein
MPTIWDEIMETRKKKMSEQASPMGVTKIYGGIPPDSATFVEFGEMEDEAQRAIEEYVSTPPGRINRELELGACDGVLKYLIFNSYNQDRCGERNMSQRLGIPRSRLHDLLVSMEWNGIVERVGVGTTSPYSVRNYGKALREGYLRLGRGEASKLMKLLYRFEAIQDLVALSLNPSLPEAKPITETHIEVLGRLVPLPPRPGMLEFVHAPFHPGCGDYSILGLADYYVACSFLRWPMMGRLAQEVLMELGVPEGVTAEEVERGLCSVAEKYLRMVRMNIKPLLELIQQHGFDEARRMIEKAYLRDRLLEQERDSTGRILPSRRSYMGDRLVEHEAVVPGHGVITLQTQELTNSHIRLLAAVYRSTCSFAEQAGVNPEVVEACREEASQLESYIEPQVREERSQEEEERQETKDKT